MVISRRSRPPNGQHAVRLPPKARNETLTDDRLAVNLAGERPTRGEVSTDRPARGRQHSTASTQPGATSWPTRGEPTTERPTRGELTTERPAHGRWHPMVISRRADHGAANSRRADHRTASTRQVHPIVISRRADHGTANSRQVAPNGHLPASRPRSGQLTARSAPNGRHAAGAHRTCHLTAGGAERPYRGELTTERPARGELTIQGPSRGQSAIAIWRAAGSPVFDGELGFDISGVRAGTHWTQPPQCPAIPLGCPRQGVNCRHALVSLATTAHTRHSHLVRHRLKVRQR